MSTKREERKMLTENQKWHLRKKLQVWNTAHMTQEKLKRLTFQPQTQKSEIKEDINFLHVTSLSLKEVPGWCPTPNKAEELSGSAAIHLKPMQFSHDLCKSQQI
jgi:hypothetical protein